MSSNIKCPVCSSEDISLFYKTTNIPIHVGIMWTSKKDALNCPKSNIRLVFCSNCSFIWNLDFDPDLLQYDGAYDNSLHFSPLYQKYAKSVADYLVMKYNLYHKDIIEIGSGRGDFLSMLCEIGNNRGVGFDLSFGGTPVSIGNQIKLIKDCYSNKYSDYKGDLICSRYVFEHIANPKEFLTMIRRTIGNRLNSIVYFEVPNVLFIIRELSIWDIIYEHYSYFNLISLQHVFNLCGFKINYLCETFDGQFISIEAFPKADTKTSNHNKDNGKLNKILNYIDNFSTNYKANLKYWNDIISGLNETNKKVVVWGAGARGVSFLNMLNINDYLKYVVDINPRKKDKFIPGTAQHIVPPIFLQEYKPDAVILTNPIYKNEIRQILNELNLHPQLLCS